jgi:hypothetical protein
LYYDPGLTANILCQTPDISGPTAGHDVELSPAVIDRVGIQLDQLERISEKVAHRVDELSSASALIEHFSRRNNAFRSSCKR